MKLGGEPSNSRREIQEPYRVYEVSDTGSSEVKSAGETMAAGAVTVPGSTAPARLPRIVDDRCEGMPDTVVEPKVAEALGGLSVEVKAPRDFTGMSPEAVQASLVEEYDRYALSIRELKKEIDALDALEVPEQHPDFVDAGSQSRVYKLEVDGEIVAVRFLGKGNSDPALSYTEGFAAKPGAEGYEQFKAASGAHHEDRATVAEYIPAKSLGRLTPDELRMISAADLKRLMTAAGDGAQYFNLDTTSGNVLHSPEVSFKIIDYDARASRNPKAVEHSVKNVIGMFSGESLAVKEQTVEGYQLYSQRCEAYADVLERLAGVCEATFPGDLGRTLKNFAELRLAMTRIAGRRYADPADVAKQIELNNSVMPPELAEDTSTPIDPENPWPGGKVRFVLCHHSVEMVPQIAVALDGCEGVLLETVGGTAGQRARHLERMRNAMDAERGTDDWEAKLALIAADSEFEAQLVRQLPESVRVIEFIDAAQGGVAFSEAPAWRRHLVQGIFEGVPNDEVAIRLEGYTRSRADNNVQRDGVQVRDIEDAIWVYGLHLESLAVISGVMHEGVHDVIDKSNYATERIVVTARDPISGEPLYTSHEKITRAYMLDPNAEVNHDLMNRGVLGSYFHALMGGERWAVPVLNRVSQEEVNTVLGYIDRLKTAYGGQAPLVIAQRLGAWYETRRLSMGLPQGRPRSG